MATAPSPPILIWQPGGGTPGGPISNPPVYSQSDVTQLVIGQAYIDVVFGSVQVDDSWVLVACEVYNNTDLAPLNIWPGIITGRTTAGFRLWLNGMPDSGNYYLSWAVSGVNILPVPATLYLFTGPTSGVFGVNKTFTVKLPPSTTLGAPITVTPDDGGAGGSFSPPTVTLSSGSATATFTYNAVAYGAATLSVTNSGTLADPAPIVYTSTAPIYTFSGPTTGVTGVASTNFTVQLLGDAAVPTTVTPHATGGGTFTPTSVLLVVGVPVHFTYTPASIGTKTISVTNDGGLADPANLSYASTAPPLVQHLLNTLISYWKLDEASGTRNDSQGTNHLTQNFNPLGATGKINNGCLFVAASNQFLSVANNATLQVSSDFTFSAWVKLTSTPTQAVLTKWGGAGFEYAMLYENATGFSFAAGPTAVATDGAHQGATVSTGVWTHVVGWYDSGTTEVYLRINDTTTTQSTTCTGPTPITDGFGIGGTAFGAGTLMADSLIDEVGFWKRKLTSDEITFLYNGGAGNPYSSFAA